MMALSVEHSLAISASFAVLIFSFMITCASHLVQSQFMTIVGGFVGSWLFVFVLTAVSNLETVMLGSGFQAKLLPEVVGSLFFAVFASGLVHRVCATTCLMFSIVALYYLNILSQKAQNKSSVAAADALANKKKRK